MSQRAFAILGLVAAVLLPLAGQGAQPAARPKPQLKPGPAPAAPAPASPAPAPASQGTAAAQGQTQGQPPGNGGVLAPSPDTGDIDEIDLKGIWRTGKGYVAQVVATNQKKTYLLKEGDQLYDGDIVSISHSEVVFKQIVQDPTALKPFREVVKSLSPSK